ncbi:MAG: radical SAM protein [Synergistaceae bacterium]|nr:radical SAM protein [Synergistaceae bacterium]
MSKYSQLSAVDKKIEIQGFGIKILPELKLDLQKEGYYPVALTWIGDDITGPFSFIGYGENSPFELRKEDGGYHVYRDDEYFSEVSFYKRPNFWDRQWSIKDGAEGTFFVDEGMSGVITPCAPNSLIAENDEVRQVTGGKFPFVTLACYNGLSIWPSYGCLYTKQGNPCTFCCIPGDYVEDHMLIQQEGWLDGMSKAVEAAIDELGSDIENCSLTVDSGTLPGRDKGAWAYIQILEAVKARIGKLPNTIYIRAVIEPPYDEEVLFKLRDAGFTSIQCDIDVYDDAERLEVMPNAKGKRSIDDYVRILTRAKEIFPGEVATQLVAGIQKDENLLKGVERFASVGIPTLVTPFLPFGQGINLVRKGKASVPGPDKMRRVYEACGKILNKYNVAPPQFRGGVSSLAETMGRRLKRVPSLTNYSKVDSYETRKAV